MFVIDWIWKIFPASYNLAESDRKRSMWGWALLGLALMVGAAWLIRAVASRAINDPMNPLYDVVNAARQSQFKFLLAWGKSNFVLFWTWIEWCWLDNLIGHRLFNYFETDSDQVKQGKKTNAAIAFVGLLIMNAILFCMV